MRRRNLIDAIQRSKKPKYPPGKPAGFAVTAYPYNHGMIPIYFALTTIVTCIALACQVSTIASEVKTRPNILILLADDLGWGDIGLHGGVARTPDVDRLAKEGVELQKYYTYPFCSPTRATLLSGRLPNVACWQMAPRRDKSSAGKRLWPFLWISWC